MAKVWLVKVRGILGAGPGDDKEISILNRIFSWEKDHLLYEAGLRHVEKLARDLGMEGCKSLTTPDTKPVAPGTILDEGGSSPGVKSDCPEPLKLDRDGMELYRSAVARCNYLAADRYETSSTTKEWCRSMSSTSVEDLSAVKRLCRFLSGLLRVL